MHDFLMWAGGIIVTAVFSLIGWAWKQHNKDIDMILTKIEHSGEKYDSIETRFEAHRLYAAETYAKKTEVEKGFDRIADMLDRIDSKLDRKVDR